MKFNLLSVVMFFGGGILVYSGVKGYYPMDVITWGLGGEKPTKMKPPGDWQDQLAPQDQSPIPGDRYPGDLNVPDPDKEGRIPA